MEADSQKIFTYETKRNQMQNFTKRIMVMKWWIALDTTNYGCKVWFENGCSF